MIIDEQIKILESNSEFERKEGDLQGCLNFKQLAEWLKDYQRLLEEQHVDDAKKHFEIICKLSQACGMPYSFVEEKIRETEKALLKALPQEPCDDAISREDALLALTGEWTELTDEIIHRFIKRIKNLPPVTPQPKMGRWKRISMDKYSEHAKYWYRCDRCGKDNLGSTDYCPNCGQPKMQEVE